jgi:PilZ domain
MRLTCMEGSDYKLTACGPPAYHPAAMGISKEKRLHPRINEQLTILQQDGAALETINLSAGGMFCTSSTFIAPMTRMALQMRLPGHDAGRPIEGEAVVVRTDPSSASPAPPGGYRIALYFSRLGDDDRRALQTFLQSRPR